MKSFYLAYVYQKILNLYICQPSFPGPSKKLSKNAAAKAALASLCNISFSPLQQSKLTSAGGAALVKNSLLSDTIFSMENNIELSQTFADKIGRLVIDKFTEIMIGNENYARRKVLAGFVMTQGTDIKTGKVNLLLSFIQL